jgi:Right handed beta helix region
MKRVAVHVLCSLVVLVLAGCQTAQRPQAAQRFLAPTSTAPTSMVSASEVDAETATLVVDGSNRSASDSNPGSAERPLRTVRRAAALAAVNNLRGIATRIRIRSGVYRETVTLGAWDGQTSAPISFEGPATGAAVLSGSDVWFGWTRVPGTNLYRHRWNYRWGLTPLPPGWDEARVPDITRRREMVFASGRLLRQTLSLAELSRTRGGAFFIDEGKGTVTLRLPSGLRIGKVKIEVATREHLLRIDSRTDVRVSNLTFRHAASPLQKAAVRVESSRNVEVSNAKFVWNNWTGLALNDDRDVSLERSTFDHNGSMGLDALRVKGLSMDHTSNSYNAWRGHWGGWHGWENGMKLGGVHQAVLRNHTATRNHSYGLWLDTDNSDITINSARICDNRLAGIFLEASQGPTTLDRTTVCRNGNYGVLAGNASKVTIANSHILGNGRAQIVLSGVQSGLPVTDWESGQRLNVQSTGWTVERNAISASDLQLLVENTWSAETWADTRASYAWNYNTWTSPTTETFRLLGTYRLGNFAEWQAHTGLDNGSTHHRTVPVSQARMP